MMILNNNFNEKFRDFKKDAKEKNKLIANKINDFLETLTNKINENFK